MKKKYIFIFVLLTILFTACQQAASDSSGSNSGSSENSKPSTKKDTFTVSFYSNRDFNPEQYAGAGEYKPGDKVTIKMNWLERGESFVGYYDDAGNLLTENKEYTFLMPHHDFEISAYFYKEGDKPLVIGDYVFFGMYPQSGSTLGEYEPEFFPMDEFDLITDYSGFNQYEFYEDGSLVSDMYYYQDVYLDKEYLYKKFRYVDFDCGLDSEHRMSDCNYVYDSSRLKTFDNSVGSWSLVVELDFYQYENHMFGGAFLYEPIKWRILEKKDGKYRLLADKALDSWQFYHSLENREINGKTIYPNNWEYSDIREWLNNDFYNTAFTKGCENYVQEVELDNVNTAWQNLKEGDDDHLIRIGKNTSTENQNNTRDKVFLPSAQDCCNAQYGFYSDNDGWDPARKFLPTEYSKQMGIRVNWGQYHCSDVWDIYPEARNHGYASYVWTRSGVETGFNWMTANALENHQGVICMDDLGDLEQPIKVTKTFVGVVPEIVISMN